MSWWEEGPALPPAPKKTDLADVHLRDRNPSTGYCKVEERGRDLVAVIEIRTDHGERMGALVIRVVGDPKTGKLGAHGISSFTEAEIQSCPE